MKDYLVNIVIEENNNIEKVDYFDKAKSISNMLKRATDFYTKLGKTIVAINIQPIELDMDTRNYKLIY